MPSDPLREAGCINSYGEVTQRAPRYSTGDSFSFAGQVFVGQMFTDLFQLVKKGHTWEHAIENAPQLCEYRTIKDYRTRRSLAVVGYGVYARSFVYAEAGRTDMMSRDQISSNVVAMGFIGHGAPLRAVSRGICKRWGFMTNTVDNDETKKGYHIPDIMDPAGYASIRRGLRKTSGFWAKLVLLTGDLQLLISVWLRVRTLKKDSRYIMNTTNMTCELLGSFMESTYIAQKARRMWAPYAEKTITGWFTRNTDEPPIHELYKTWPGLVLRI